MRAALPEVRESAAVFGETDLAGHLPKPLPIAGVMGDSQASMFAQHCYEGGAINALAALPRDVTVCTPRADRQGIDRSIDGWHRAVDRVLLSPEAA